MSDTINKTNKRQSAHNANYYKVQVGRTDDNKRKRLRRHLRRFPNDGEGVKIWTERYGRKVAALDGVTAKGAKVLDRAARIARARAGNAHPGVQWS